MNSRKKIEKEFLKLQNPQKGKILARFFKTGKGEYGEGDVFLGISVGDQRKLAIFSKKSKWGKP